MDLNSTSCTSDALVFRTQCDANKCPAGAYKNGWNGGILFHDCDQGLSEYRCKWLEEDKGMGLGMSVLGLKKVTPNPNPTFSTARVRVRVTLALTLK